MKIELHEKGAKGERDRLQVVKKYDEFCSFFHHKRMPDSELAKMTNNQVYRLIEDLYNRQPGRKKIKYAQYLGLNRENDTSFKWWWLDIIHVYKPNLIGYIVLLAKVPWLYPAYVKRKKATIAAKKKMAEEAKKTMQDAAKAPTAKDTTPFPGPEADKA